MERLRVFIKLVYSLTDKLPSSENFGLKPQMRRAVASIISNFVEGYLKISKKNKVNFLEIANTSLLELEAQGESLLLYRYRNAISKSVPI